MDAEQAAGRPRSAVSCYRQVAARSWSCLSSAGDALATWQAVSGGRCQLRRSVDWGYLGELPTGSPAGLLAPALALARPAWAAILTEPGLPALAALTSKGDIQALAQAAAEHPRGDAAASWRSAPGMLAPALAKGLQMGIYLPVSAVAACSTGLYALLEAADSIERGRCRRALVVASDRSLAPLVLAGFAALGASCGHTQPSGDGAGGIGFAPAEGIAAIALAPSGPWRLCAGVRAGDAGHRTAFTDPGTLQHALDGLWQAAPAPDGILVHGTGTKAGEAYEAAALAQGPWRELPRLRCKPWIGHALGASALVELAATWHGPWRSLWQISLGFGGHLAAAAWERS